jgi:hypothetical protein
MQWEGETPAGIADVAAGALEAEHPDAQALRGALIDRGLAEAVKVRPSPHPRLVARLRHRDGREVTLTSA